MVSRASRKVVKAILILGFSGLLKRADSVILDAEVESVGRMADLVTSIIRIHLAMSCRDVGESYVK